jgi:hypothetical protein
MGARFREGGRLIKLLVRLIGILSKLSFVLVFVVIAILTVILWDFKLIKDLTTTKEIKETFLWILEPFE